MIDCYVINLQRSPQRLKTMDEQFCALDVPYMRVNAVDGRESGALDSVAVSSPSWRYPHALFPGEIACFCSHREAWKQIAKGDSDWAAVFEDDVVLSSQIGGYLNNESWIPQNVTLIQLAFSRDQHLSRFSRRIPIQNNELLRFQSGPVSTLAYLMRRELAEEAVRLSEVIDEPVDNFLFGHYSDFSQHHPSYRMLRSYVRAQDDVESDVGEKGCHDFSMYALCPNRLFTKLRWSMARKKGFSALQEWVD